MESRSACALLFAAILAAPAVAAAQNNLPEGEAKEAVLAMCVQCHQIGRVTGMHSSHEEWKNTVEDMVRMGAQIPPDWVDPIVEYLALNYPERPSSSDAGGNHVEVSMDIVRLPPQASSAQAIVPDGNGDVWLINTLTATISKYSLATATLVEHPLPASARTLESPVADADGLWFSLRESHAVARFQPATAAIGLAPIPRADAVPDAGALDPGGVPFFIERNTNRIIYVTPASMTTREYVLPNPAARPRSVAIGSDGLIWYFDERGFIGRFDPVAQTAHDWSWPGGGQPPPGGLAVLRGEVWSTQCTGEVCRLIRFDPKAAAFQTWPMTDGTTAVTRLVATASGQLAATSTGSNQLIVITVK